MPKARSLTANHRPRLCALFVVGCAAFASPAFAEPDTQAAAELFRAGEQAFQRGDHIGAALTFEQAYEQAPAGATAFAAATAWYKAGNMARAADAYQRAITAGGLPEDRAKHASDRVSELSTELGRIEITAPEGRRASVAYRRAAIIPFSVFVPPGKHQVKLDGAAPGSGGDVSVTVDAGGVEQVKLTLPDGPKPTPETPRPAPAPPPTDTASSGPSPAWGYAALGAAALSAGGALYFRSQALDSVDEFESSGDQGARDDAVSQRTLSYALWGVAGAFAVTGVTILVWPSSDGEQSATRLSVTGSGVRLSGSF